MSGLRNASQLPVLAASGLIVDAQFDPRAVHALLHPLPESFHAVHLLLQQVPHDGLSSCAY